MWMACSLNYGLEVRILARLVGNHLLGWHNQESQMSFGHYLGRDFGVEVNSSFITKILDWSTLTSMAIRKDLQLFLNHSLKAEIPISWVSQPLELS